LVGTGGLANIGEFVLPDVQPAKRISKAKMANTDSLSIDAIVMSGTRFQDWLGPAG
jgi:hypothetical protein